MCFQFDDDSVGWDMGKRESFESISCFETFASCVWRTKYDVTIICNELNIFDRLPLAVILNHKFLCF